MDLDGITQETIDNIAKAQTAGVNSGTGIFGVDLTGLVSLVPVNTVTRNSLPRETSPDGAKISTWRSFLNVNNSQPSPAVGFDVAGSLVQIDEQDVSSSYFPLAIAVRVTQDSIDLSKGYADAKALATLQGLNQLMIGENKMLLGGQNWALGTPAPAGGITTSTSTTGGSLAATSTFDVQVCARSGYNYFYGGNSLPATKVTSVTTGAGSTNTITATIKAIPGAVAYDWYFGAHAGTLYYFTTTTVATVTCGVIPTSLSNTTPTTLPDLSSVQPSNTPPVTDTSAPKDVGGNLCSFNGVIATILGDYSSSTNGPLVAHGTGTSNGATFIDAGAGTFTLNGQGVSQIDDLLLGIWQSVRLSPQFLVMNAQQAQDLTARGLGGSNGTGATIFVTSEGAANATLGGFFGNYVNKAAGGSIVKIVVEPHLPMGTIIARTDVIPFPGANIDTAWKVRTLRDYSSFEYGAAYVAATVGGGPRSDSEVRSVETLICRAGSAQGLITNLANG